MTYKISESNGWAKIYINDILHLLINKKKLTGIQSWKYDEEWCIEIYYDTSTIFCAYDNAEMWMQILCLLNDRLLVVN